MNDRRDFEVWIEAKRLWLKISKNANWEFDSVARERINNALWQIDNIKKANPYQSAETNFKVAFFTMSLSCTKSQIPSDDDIESAPKIVADFVDNRRNMGVLCAVLDLDMQGKKDELIYEGEYTPYFALGAIVLE